MAKETLEALRQAEEKANQTIIDSKSKSEDIIASAVAQKQKLLQDLENQKKENYNKVCKEAKMTSENIFSLNKAEIKENSEKLEKGYLENKDKAISEVIKTIL
ncbi:MAG: hypothetical protein R3Y35_12600 [Clostridia bacterium]